MKLIFGTRLGGSGGFPFHPGPGSGRGPPPPPGFKTTFGVPPPSYEETCNRNTASSSRMGRQGGSDNGPGFFSGLALGALGGYFFGNSRSESESVFKNFYL